MEPTIRGLEATRAMVTSPIQWQLLLALADQSQSTGRLLKQTSVRYRWHYWFGLFRLQRHQLVMFHMKQWCWSVTAAGETLRPILNAIQTCHATQKGGNSNDL